MIKHIVMWRLKDHAEGADKSENAVKMKALLDTCSDVVPGIHTFEVAFCWRFCDIGHNIHVAIQNKIIHLGLIRF